MDCDKMIDLMSFYIDNEIDAEEKEAFVVHLKSCEHCQKEFETTKRMVEEMKKADYLPLPEGYHEELMGKINSGKVTHLHSNKKGVYRKKYMGLAVAGFVFAVVGIGSGLDFSGKNSMPSEITELEQESNSVIVADIPENEETEILYSEITEESLDEMSTFSIPTEDAVTGKRMVEDVQLNLEYNMIMHSYIVDVEATENLTGEIIENIEGLNGYVVSVKTTEENIELMITVPSYNIENAKTYIKSLGLVASEGESVKNLTQEYTDLQNEMYLLMDEDFEIYNADPNLENTENLNRIEEIWQEIDEIRKQMEFIEVQNQWITVDLAINKK